MNAIPETAIPTAWTSAPLSEASRLCQRARELFGVEVLQIRGRRRIRSHVQARHWVWNQLRALDYSYPEIAREFGVDHTTVIYGVRRVRQ